MIDADVFGIKHPNRKASLNWSLLLIVPCSVRKESTLLACHFEGFYIWIDSLWFLQTDILVCVCILPNCEFSADWEGSRQNCSVLWVHEASVYSQLLLNLMERNATGCCIPWNLGNVDLLVHLGDLLLYLWFSEFGLMWFNLVSNLICLKYLRPDMNSWSFCLNLQHARIIGVCQPPHPIYCSFS